MKVFFLLLMMFMMYGFPLQAQENGHKQLSEEELRPILNEIKPYAIRFGEGKKEVHVFVDPMCTLSKEYMKWVTSNTRLQKRYTYYIYMYKLKKYDSMNLMRYIYANDYPFPLLKQVMVDNYKPDTSSVKPVPAIEKKIADIAKACKKIDVYKRPYFIILRSEK